MARNAVASIGNLRFGRQRTDDSRGEKASRSFEDRRRENLTCFVVRRASPPQPAASGGAGLAVVGHHRAVERAVERREYATLDEVEGGGLAGAGAGASAPRPPREPARARAHAPARGRG